MRITTDDGVELAVEVAGSGPGLVLVHGFGGAKEDFADHVPALAAEHTVVIFDHRGHGASDKPTSSTRTHSCDSQPTRCRSPTRSGSTRSASLVTRWVA